MNKPTLPPKAGYIEIEVNGVHKHQKIPNETEEKLAALERAQMLTTQVIYAKLEAMS